MYHEMLPTDELRKGFNDAICPICKNIIGDGLRVGFYTTKGGALKMCHYDCRIIPTMRESKR